MANRIFIFLAAIIFWQQSHAALVDIQTQDDKTYFLFSAPNKVSVYDLTSNAFLDDIHLDSVPTAFLVENNAIYIGYHRKLEKLNLSDLTVSFIRNFSTDIQQIMSIGSNLYIAETNSNVQAINKLNNELIETRDSFYSGSDFIASNVNQNYYYRTSGVSPSDIRMVQLNADGTTISDTDSPYHGDYPSANKLYLNNSENKIYDNSGIIYFSSDLNYAGSLSGAHSALCFKEDNPIVARENRLYLYSSSHIEQGELTLNHAPLFLSCTENNVVSFSYDGVSIKSEVSDISAFQLPSPGEPVDPNTIEFVPERVEIDETGNVYLLDIQHLSIFTWSTSTEAYISSRPLLNPPTWMSYSESHKRLYLGYSSGKITYFQIDNEDNTNEQHLTSLPRSVLGLLAVEDYLFAADESGAWESHYLLNSDGSIQDSREWRNTSSQYLYSHLTNRVYHHRDGSSPNDIEWTEFDPVTGLFGSDGDSPYHGGDLSTKPPLRLNLAGDLIINGAGQLLDAYSLNILNSLANNISDAVFLSNGLVTINETGSQLQYWDTSYQLTKEYDLSSARGGRIFAQENELILVQFTDVRPSISKFSPSDLPDSDNDGIDDFNDNCINKPNPDQINTDGDTLGNACDEDDDGDGLPDNVEDIHSLNPLDSNDALLDLDGDGFNNVTEHLLGTNLNDINSHPEKLTNYTEGFEGEWPVGFHQNQYGTPWSITSSFSHSGNQSLRSNEMTTDINSSISFLGYFDTGILSFNYKNDSDYYYYLDLRIFVDDQPIKTISASSNTDWRSISIAIEEGLHTIRFESSVDRTLPNNVFNYFYIDDLKIEGDRDGDGIGDSLDNCPDTANSYQWDDDNDGLGNDCDNSPYGQDRDDDGWGDSRDNCPDVYNPDQENVDNDTYGDACDSQIDLSDYDFDSVADIYDNCPWTSNPDQSDIDLNGIGDACEDPIEGTNPNRKKADDIIPTAVGGLSFLFILLPLWARQRN